MKHHSERDLLAELFPEVARREYGANGVRVRTLGLYPVAEGKLALVSGERLLELEPLEPKVRKAAQCDLCHTTRSGDEVRYYRAPRGEREYLYVSLCTSTRHCLERAGNARLNALAGRLLGDEGVGPAPSR